MPLTKWLWLHADPGAFAVRHPTTAIRRSHERRATGTSGRTNLVLESNEPTPPENFLSPGEQLVGVVLTSDPPYADKLEEEGEALSTAEACEMTAAALSRLVECGGLSVVSHRAQEAGRVGSDGLCCRMLWSQGMLIDREGTLVQRRRFLILLLLLREGC
jgi:hypothetical protein